MLTRATLKEVPSQLTRERAVALITIQSTLVASAKVKKTTLVVELSAIIEGLLSSSGLAAIAAVLTKEDLVTSSGLLNNYRKSQQEAGELESSTSNEPALMLVSQ